jgi:CopG family nickel-responsive transcriptional regulator
MVIISMSVDSEMLDNIDAMQALYGFAGRSETIRAGVRLLEEDARAKGKLSGKLNAVLLVVHQHAAEDAVGKIRYEFEDVVKTQLHAHLKGDVCMELIVLEGSADKIRELSRRFITHRKIGNAKLIVP